MPRGILFAVVITLICGLFAANVLFSQKSKDTDALVNAVTISDVQFTPNADIVLVTFGNGKKLNILSDELPAYRDPNRISAQVEQLHKSYKIKASICVLIMSIISLLYVLWVHILEDFITDKMQYRRKYRKY